MIRPGPAGISNKSVLSANYVKIRSLLIILADPCSNDFYAHCLKRVASNYFIHFKYCDDDSLKITLLFYNYSDCERYLPNMM